MIASASKRPALRVGEISSRLTVESLGTARSSRAAVLGTKLRAIGVHSAQSVHDDISLIPPSLYPFLLHCELFPWFI